MTANELIHSLDFDAMLYKLSKDETLSDSEISALDQFISGSVNGSISKRSLEDLYAALTVLVKNNSDSLAYLVEQCLDIHDSLIVALALETLVIKWNLSEGYEERLIQYLLGVPFDHDGDIKESAIKCLGYILEGRLVPRSQTKADFEGWTDRDKKLMSLLLQLAEDTNEDEIIRTAAYQSLLTATQGAPSVSENPSFLEDPSFSENSDSKDDLIRLVKSYVSESSSLTEVDSGVPERGIR